MSVLENMQLKTILRWLLIGFYFVAGVNHFVHPAFYLPLIPPSFPMPEWINWGSGVLEVLLAIGVAVPSYRKAAVYLIILMLIAFIPSHIYFIQIGACVSDESLCTPLWVAWARLIVIHPMLIYWAWKVR